MGIAGVDTRALTALIRDKGMQNAVLIHSPAGIFDRKALQKAAKALPSMDGLDLVPHVTGPQRYDWDETTWAWGEGYGRQESRNSMSSRSITASSGTSCASSPRAAAR